MKKIYLKPELETLDVELESMIAATGGVDNPGDPLPDIDFSREVSIEDE